MNKLSYLKLGVAMGILAPIGQYILSRDTFMYSETKTLLIVMTVISLLQIGCYFVAYKKENLQYAFSMIGVALFFVMAFFFIYLEKTTGGGVLPSGSTIFLWIPQAWALKTYAKQDVE